MTRVKDMSAESNKQVVLEYVAAFNRGDMAALEKLFTPDALVYGVLGWGGLDQVIPIWREIRAAFAIELRVAAMCAEGDTVAVRYDERDTSDGCGDWACSLELAAGDLELGVDMVFC